MGGNDLAVRVLGPVHLVSSNGYRIELGSAGQRRLLAGLAIHAPHPVRSAWLCLVLDVSPGALRTAIARLRRVIGPDALHTSGTGYRLNAQVDAHLACDELDRAGGEPDAIRAALGRWAGPALEEFADEPWAVAEATRLNERRATATEDLAEVLIARRLGAEAVALLEPHVIDHPHRDRPRGLLARALVCAGRRTDALRAYQSYRAFLADSYGTEPSAELTRIDRMVATGWDGVTAAVDAPLPAVADGREHGAVPAVLALPTVFVGRQHERAVLADALHQAEGGVVSTVLLAGEAGIGKTALLGSFARECCAAEGWDVRYGRCDEHATSPFQPFQSLLGQVVDDLPDDVLAAHSAACGGDLAMLVPRLRTRVEVPSDAVGHNDLTGRHLLFEAAVDILRRAAASVPVVLMVDDLHWAEPADLLLLRHLVGNLAGVRVLFVVTFRDTGEGHDDQFRAAIADLTRSRAIRVELRGFSAPELGELVRANVRDAQGRDAQAVADRLGAETSGNPLLAEHLLRHWQSGRHLSIGDRTLTLAPDATHDVPSTLRDLVWHRVAVLGPDGERVLRAAAILGVDFDEAVVGAMTALDPSALASVLDRAVAAHLIIEDPSTPGIVRFAHALVARALEAENGSRARARLHEQAFAALLATADRLSHGREAAMAAHAAQLARHADRGRMRREAQHWAAVAGDHALAHHAPDEAAEWFKLALANAESLGEADSARADLLVRLAEAEHGAGAPTAMETLERGASLAVRCGADQTVIRAALTIGPGRLRFGTFARTHLPIAEAASALLDGADVSTRARVLAVLAQDLVHTAQTQRRVAITHQALALARAADDPVLLARIAPDVLYALWAPGSGALRSQVAEEAAAIVDDIDDPNLAFNVHYLAYTAAICAGDAEAAARHLDRVRAIADAVGAAPLRWSVAVTETFTATMEGRFDDAERLMAAAFDLGSQIGEAEAWTVFATQVFVLGTFRGRHAELLPIIEHALATQDWVELPFRIGHAMVCCEVGNGEPARALLGEAKASGLDAIAPDLVRSTSLIGLAILALELEDVDAAAWLYPEVAPLAFEVSFNGMSSQGPIAAYAGKLASLLGHHEAAERFLMDALAVADAFGWPYHRATTVLALAANRERALGRLDADGDRWLAEAERLCAEHGIANWARRASELRTRSTQ